MPETTTNAPPIYILKLYITGRSPRAERAVEALKSLCARRLANQHELEVINIIESPDAADDARILATPTVIKFSPGQEMRVIGDLTDEARVVEGLDLPSEIGSAHE